MKKKKLWVGSGFFLVILVVLGCLFFNHQRKVQLAKSEAQSRAAILNSNKPLTDKVGTFIWLYAYTKGSHKNQVYIKSQLELAKKTDFKYVVLPIVFNKEYIQRGKYDFSEFDKTINIAQKNHLVPIIEFSADNAQDNHLYEKTPNKVISKYEKLIKTAILRYKNRGVVWQMWNEPNSLFWFNQSEDGADKSLIAAWNGLGRKMKRWVRGNDPNSVFLGGALAGNYKDSHESVRLAMADGLSNYADAISNHPYLSSTEPNNGAPENLFTLDSRKLLIQLSRPSEKDSVKKIPLVTTEFGYSMGKTHHGIWSEGDQANYLARSIFVLDMMHQPIISLYSLVDEGNGDGQWGMYRGEAPYYSAKQSGQLVMELLSNLNGYTYNHRIRDKSDQDFILKYVKNKRSNRYVCWTMGSNHNIRVANQNVTLSQTPQIVYEK